MWRFKDNFEFIATLVSCAVDYVPSHREKKRGEKRKVQFAMRYFELRAYMHIWTCVVSRERVVGAKSTFLERVKKAVKTFIQAWTKAQLTALLNPN